MCSVSAPVTRSFDAKAIASAGSADGSLLPRLQARHSRIGVLRASPRGGLGGRHLTRRARYGLTMPTLRGERSSLAVPPPSAHVKDNEQLRRGVRGASPLSIRGRDRVLMPPRPHLYRFVGRGRSDRVRGGTGLDRWRRAAAPGREAVGERPLTSKHRRRFEPRRLFWQRPETQWMMWRRRSAGVRTCWDRAVPPVRGVGASRRARRVSRGRLQ
jgi:hypothetical protein